LETKNIMPLQILIVDDDRSVRVLIRECLQLEGYSVIEARNGEEALSLAKQYHPHLLISDIIMPGKNGYELVKELRQNPHFRLLPVIFLTQQNTTDARISGYQAGCDIYLPKPFQIQELNTVVRSLLERAQIVQSELWFSVQNSESNSELVNNIESFDLCDLTKRESDVLTLISQGFSNKKIAQELHLSSKTVEKYVSNLLQKTRTNNRTELLRFAFDHNLIS
jgi:DNA-binding NarL/FixJ family response regulator